MDISCVESLFNSNLSLYNDRDLTAHFHSSGAMEHISLPTNFFPSFVVAVHLSMDSNGLNENDYSTVGCCMFVLALVENCNACVLDGVGSGGCCGDARPE